MWMGIGRQTGWKGREEERREEKRKAPRAYGGYLVGMIYELWRDGEVQGKCGRALSLFPVLFSGGFFFFFHSFFKNSSRDLNTSSPNRHDC